MSNIYAMVSVVEAIPMDLRSYSKMQGCVIESNENPYMKGYRLKYPTGYVMFQPADTFNARSIKLAI